MIIQVLNSADYERLHISNDGDFHFDVAITFNVKY